MPGFGRLRRPRKPLMIAVVTVILLVGGWVAFAWLSPTFSDRFESYYPSLAEAKKDGAIDRGWVPDDILPSSSRNIHEVHDLSPSREWCAFEFAPNDSERLRKSLKSIGVCRRQFAVCETRECPGGPLRSREILMHRGFATKVSISTRLNGQPTPFRASSCSSPLIGQKAEHSSTARTSRTSTQVNWR